MSRDLFRKTWLERHPKKVICLLVFVVICGLTLAAEKILAHRDLVTYHFVRHPLGVKRFIKLREFEPGYAEVLSPSPADLSKSDNPAQGKFIVRVDENGFIMPAKVHEHPDLTLVFLGGSTTECLYNPEDNRFPYLVGRLLEESTGLKVNSYNGARSGNDSLHSLNILLNKVVNLQPDLVVMMHNINDLGVLLYEHGYWKENSPRGPILEQKPGWALVGKNMRETFWLARDLLIPHLYGAWNRLRQNFENAGQDEFRQIRGRKIEVDQDFLVREFTRNLRTFTNICRARGITPVLMTMPSRMKDAPDPLIRTQFQHLEEQNGISYREYKGAFDRFNQAIREVGAQNQVLVVDLAREIPQEKEYMSDAVHFTATGSEMVAQKIAAGLSPLLASFKKQPEGR
ncbi:MAG: SGNH/GDSL hydrolase family protein [Desulfobaccales bacterium]